MVHSQAVLIPRFSEHFSVFLFGGNSITDQVFDTYRTGWGGPIPITTVAGGIDGDWSGEIAPATVANNYSSQANTGVSAAWGDVWRGRVWAKVGEGTVEPYLQFYNAGFTLQQSVLLTPSGGPVNGWQLYTATAEAPPITDFVFIIVYSQSATEPVTIDGAQLPRVRSAEGR